MSLLLRFGKLVLLSTALCVSAPAALAQGPAVAPDSGATFQCEDGSKLVLDFAASEAGNGVAAMVWVRGASHRLVNVPPEPGPVQVVWSDGERSLTWSPGVQLMWMASDVHLMCGRSGHKH